MGSALGGMSAHTRKGRPTALGDQRWGREGRETQRRGGKGEKRMRRNQKPDAQS